ncbi:MAG: FKBP-type peptidyl-prolyl cis-trans isomerase [Vicinamibacteria bacterium]|nr:FKBP-type peptidyl-prolyl cis-trans isomerase [Vicinamibacteria bacterium]
MKLTKNFLGLMSALALAVFLPACGSTSPSDGTLGIEDPVVGTGPTVVNGDTVTVTYVGTLTNGSQFDAGRITFRVGAGAVIKGWDEGLPGMRVGGTRRLTVPPNLGYGSQANGAIPANSTLKFDIVLLSIAGK